MKEKILNTLRDCITLFESRGEVISAQINEKIQLFKDVECNEDFIEHLNRLSNLAQNAIDEEGQWRCSFKESYPGNLLKYFEQFEIIDGKLTERSFNDFINRINSGVPMEFVPGPRDDDDEDDFDELDAEEVEGSEEFL